MKYKFGTFSNMQPDTLGGVITGDVAIVAASWENRSKTALSVLKHVHVKKLIVVRFRNVGSTGVSGNIRNKFKTFCRDQRIQYTEVLFDSVAENYANLIEACKFIDTEVGGSRKVILDITSTPRILWCSLVALWDKKTQLES